MARYTEDSVDRVREAIDMVDLVGSRTELRRTGGTSYMAICPFHDERTPSMSVDVLKKLYHCFGCDAGGDAISFVREIEGVDFVGALEWLADRYGVELQVAEEDPEEAARRARRERLFSLLDRTASYYERVLWEAAEAAPAREYLLGRGLTEEALRTFRVGYSRSAWDSVLMASRRAGFSNQELFDSGLARRGREGRLYDQFRGRIMFPLADQRGRVVGFGARAMGEARGPKYLNTVEGELFHKGRQVYAAHVARAAAAKEGRVIVVEGYTDVIALWQAGFANTVAIMGTSLTEAQVEALRRLAPVALLALDADNAGQEAMLRGARVAEGKKLELRVVPLPPGSDPAEIVAGPGGAETVAGLLGRSIPFVRFRVDRALARGDTTSAEGKDAILTALRPVFAGMPPSVLRDELVRVVADRLDVEPGLAVGLLFGAGAGAAGARGGGGSRAGGAGRSGGAPGYGAGGAGRSGGAPGYGEAGVESSLGAGGGPGTGPPRSPAGELLARTDEVERRFLAFCISLPSAGREALAAIDPPEHFTSPLLVHAAEHLREHLDDPLAGLAPDDELSTLLPELVARASQEPATAASLKAQRLQLDLRRLDRRLRAARAAGEPVREWAMQKAKVKAELNDAVERSVSTS